MKNISPHITYHEATMSQTAIRRGIENTPNECELKNMGIVANACFEPLREWYGKPLYINSFFRCEILNTEIRGQKNSQHIQGRAIDISAGNKIENEKIFQWAKLNLKFDQLIDEFDFSWIHVSFDLGHNRNQIIHVKK